MGGCGVSFGTFAVRASWDDGRERSRKASQGPTTSEAVRCKRNPDQMRLVPLMFKQHTVRLTGCEATTGLCNQLRLLICSRPVARTERGKERKHTGKRLYPRLICKSFQQPTNVRKPVQTRGVKGGDSCMQLLFLLTQHNTHTGWRIHRRPSGSGCVRKQRQAFRAARSTLINTSSFFF